MHLVEIDAIYLSDCNGLIYISNRIQRCYDLHMTLVLKICVLVIFTVLFCNHLTENYMCIWYQAENVAVDCRHETTFLYKSSLHKVICLDRISFSETKVVNTGNTRPKKVMQLMTNSSDKFSHTKLQT